MDAETTVPVSRRQHFAIAWFAIVMGLGGTAVAWHKAEKVLDLGTPVGLVLGYVALAAFVVIAIVYCFKAAHPIPLRRSTKVGDVVRIFVASLDSIPPR